MTIKVSELTGNLLDHWAARANGMKKGNTNYAGYSTHWNVGGPIIEREDIATNPLKGVYGIPPELCWRAEKGVDVHYGPTLLIAAMRAFVGSKFGDEVDDS